MLKRFTILCLTAVLLLGLVLPMAVQVHAEYDNTHVNTGNQRADIIAVAVTQLGYAEEAGGWTKYGAYHGNAYADWCGYFVSWCARQAGVPTSVLKKQGWAAASKWGLSTFTASQRTPQPGDLYFRGTAHCGLVYYVDGSTFYTLEGNSIGDKVISRGLDLYSGSYTFASPNYGGSDNSGHSHAMELGYESAHPHKEYQKCACGYSTYTGYNKTLDDCITCRQENCDHAFSNWESAGDSQHSRECSKCELVETADHGWEDLQTLKEPTCAETGEKTQSCSACGGERTLTLEKTDDHRYSVWKSEGESGHSHVCSVCEKKETVTHNWKDVKVTKEPTCKETGLKEQECSTCGEERTATVDKTDDHQYGEWTYTDATYHSHTCKTCGVRHNGEHNVDQDAWATDGEKHWHECADCKEKYGEEEHTFSGDCVSPCDVCQYLSPEGHNYGAQWQSDDSQHWQVCVDCGEETLAKKHTYDGKCDPDCNGCGYTRDAGHNYAPMILMDAASHWRQCEECGYKDGYEAHVPGEAATEETAQNCTVCGYELAAVLEHVHEYTYSSDNDTHWGVCRCGDKLAPENHGWDMATGKCAFCGAYGVEQTATSQNWDFVWLIIAGAVVATTVVTTVVMIRNLKKRKAARA